MSDPVTINTKISAPTNVSTKLNPAALATANKTPPGLPAVKVLSRNAKDIDISKGNSKGLERAIGVTAHFIIDAQTKTSELLYGKYSVSEDEINPIKKALDKGIIKLLEVVAGVDFCNLINYAINNVPGGKKFNPKDTPPTDSLGKKKWYIQNKAFQIQSFIDGYYTQYGDAKNPESKLGLYALTKEISNIFDSLLNPNSGLNDPDLTSAFPQLSIFNNFLQNSLGIFNKYTDLRQIPNSELQKIIGYVDKVRGISIAIQGLNSAASAVSLADTFTNGAVSDEIAKLSSQIPVTKLIPTLKSILKTANKINSVGRKIVGFINSSRFLIKLLMGLIWIFNLIKAYFFAIPLGPPPIGATAKLSDVVQNKLTIEGNKRLIRRLGQINSVLSLLSSFAVLLISGMVNIIGKLELILLNIENCDNVDPSLAEEIKDTINNLVGTTNDLQKFISEYEDNKNKLNTNFGKYQIKIVDEEITDQGIGLKRRYGVALDINGVLAVQTTPTFASLDQIIINEVKVLLVSKGLVNSAFSAFPIGDIEIMNEALNYTGEVDINIDDMQITNFDSGLDAPDNTDPEQGSGLNAFINNLPGGKALKRRMRKLMIKNSEQLKTDLKKTDPNGKYTSDVIKKNDSEINQLKIDDLEAEKKKLKETLATTTNPASTAAIVRKIKDIDDQIRDLKNH
jgi:hypothetical protein